MCRQWSWKATAAIIAVMMVLPLSFANADQPNIIFILADDQGWNGLSVQMHPDMPEESRSDYYRTPHLEELAKAGMRFSSAYAPGPMCSPTRASLQTGKSPAQLGMTNVGGSGRASASQKLLLPPNSSTLSTDETTIGEVLQRAGYATAYFGKWHLGGNGPGDHGYDVHDGPTGNQNGDVEDPNPKDIFGITERGMAFIDKNAGTGKPFYLQLWHYAVHGPVHCLKKTEEACAARPAGSHHTDPAYAAMTEDLDTSVGMIMDKVKQLGLADNTYIIYSSDHGAPTNLSTNVPLNRGKGTLWEGGLRVPFIISGPGIKSGVFCNTRVVGWDLFPTFCELAAVAETLPEGLEGASLTPLFANGTGTLNRPDKKEVAFHFPHYRREGPHSTIHVADYKLLKYYEDDDLLLFNLKDDIGEQKNLSQTLPNQAKLMHARLANYLEDIGAGVPKPNPDYDPTAPSQAQARGGRGGGRRGAKVDPQTNSSSPRAIIQKAVLAIEEAFKQQDQEQMKQRTRQAIEIMEKQPARQAKKSAKGVAGRPSPREARLKALKELEAACNRKDMDIAGELLKKIMTDLENQPRPGARRPGGRGQGRRGGGG